MTRSEFIDDVTEWYELVNVMSDSEYDYHNDFYVYDDESYDEQVKYDIGNNDRMEWYELRRDLDDCPDSQSYHYYRRDGEFDYVDVTDDFYYYKQEVLDWLVDADWFDEEDEDYDDEEDGSDGFYVAVDVEEEPEEEDMELSDDVAGDGFSFHAIALEVA